MHTHTVQTKFTFGDHVRYSSELNGSGVGEVISVTIHTDGHYYYIMLDGDASIQGGILENEMEILSDEADPPEYRATSGTN